MSLFKAGEFVSHSGLTLPYKIDCDALTNSDLETLAAQVAKWGPFERVYGVPSGGWRFADALRPYCKDSGGTLGEECKGAVIFARGVPPNWVTALFMECSPL